MVNGFGWMKFMRTIVMNCNDVGIKIFSKEFNAAFEAAHKHFRGNPKKNECKTFLFLKVRN